MKVFTVKTSEGVLVRALANNGHGTIADFSHVVKPGTSAIGHPYEWWAALADGEHDIKPKSA